MTYLVNCDVTHTGSGVFVNCTGLDLPVGMLIMKRCCKSGLKENKFLFNMHVVVSIIIFKLKL